MSELRRVVQRIFFWRLIVVFIVLGISSLGGAFSSPLLNSSSLTSSSLTSSNSVPESSLPSTLPMSQRETVIIATGELPPHSSRLSPHYGYVNHVIAVAFNEVNIKAKFHFLPWARAYKDANDAVYPASSYWYRDVKHEVGFYHSDTIIRDRVVFFRKKSALKLSSIDDIKRHRLRVGLTRGFTYSNEVWQWADENVDLVSIVNSDEQNLKMLVLGRIDVFPADEISGWYALNKNFSAEQVQTIETVAQGLINRDAVLLFSKAHAESERLMAAFNKGLQIIGEKGLLDEMTLQFVSGDYAENERH